MNDDCTTEDCEFPIWVGPEVTTPVVVAPVPVVIDELADTGVPIGVDLMMLAGLLLSLGLGMLKWAFERRSVTHDNHS